MGFNNDKYKPLEIGTKAFFMPWKDIIIKDTIIKVHQTKFQHDGIWKKATLYEFEHIQGNFRAYATKEEIENALKL